MLKILSIIVHFLLTIIAWTSWTWLSWWFKKIGIKNYNREHLFMFVRYYLPLLLVLVGILFQDVLGIIKPFI